MREGWKEVRLGDVISTNKSNLNKNYKFEKILYVDISSVGSGDISFNDEILLNEAPSRAKRLVKNGDTIISSVRPANRNFAYFKEVPHNLVVSTGFTTLHPNVSEINSRYLYYLISNEIFTEYLVSVEKGANYPAVTAKDIEDYVFNLPPLETQKKIASILSGYDDLIENNLKRIKILEEMAQQTYEEWFVRMRFPGHESAKINSETGLPEGWDIFNLGDAIENYDSKRKPLSSMQREKRVGIYPYYGASSVMAYIDDYLFDKRLVLMGEDGTVITKKGTPMLQFVEGKIWVNNHAHVLNGIKISNEYLYCFLNQYQISSHITGVAQPKINQANLNRIQILIPSEIIKKKFEEFSKNIFDIYFNLQSQNQRLREARDILLPRLMMGMIEVDNLKENESSTKTIFLNQVKKEASKEFKEAVLIACLVDRFGSQMYPLGRKRYTKLSYLFHRYSDNKIEDYKRKAAGPYNPKTKYAGPEKIALGNKYIKNWKSDKGTAGFVVSDKIGDAQKYYSNYWPIEDLDWLTSKFKFKSNDELELYATVDNSLVELAKNNLDFTVKNVLEIIKAEKEWEAKLEREIFNEQNIKKSIDFLISIFCY